MAQAGPNQVVQHEIIITQVNIPKFSGESDTIDVNQFLQKVDTMIANRGITNENLKI